jgi:hypothetical protein
MRRRSNDQMGCERVSQTLTCAQSIFFKFILYLFGNQGKDFPLE